MGCIYRDGGHFFLNVQNESLYFAEENATQRPSFAVLPTTTSCRDTLGQACMVPPVRRVSCVGRWAVGGVHQPMAPLLRLSDSTPELNKYVAPACPWSSAGQTEEGGGGAREGGVGEERVEAQSGREWSKPDRTSSSWARGGWCRGKLKRWNDGLIRRLCSVFMLLLFRKPAQNSTLSVREDVKIHFALVWRGDEDSKLKINVKKLQSFSHLDNSISQFTGS